MKQLIIKKTEILNRAKDYYHNNIDFLREKAKNKYRKLPEEGKTKKREYTKNRHKNLSEEKKQKFKEYQKNIEKIIVKLKKKIQFCIISFSVMVI